MKHYLKLTWLVLVLSLGIWSCLSKEGDEDRDRYIKKVFTTFQKNDIDGFVRLFPDSATMDDLLRRVLANKNLSPEMREPVSMALAANNETGLRMRYSQDFYTIINLGESKGVDWKKTGFENYTFTQYTDSLTGFDVIKGRINFSEGEKKYFLEYDEVLFVGSKGWLGFAAGRIGPGENK